MSEELQQEVVNEVEQPQVSEPEKSEQTEKPSETTAEKTFTQAELDEIVQKRLTKFERKLERQRREGESLPKATEEHQPQLGNKPKSEDFSTYDEFIEALADYKAESKIVELDTKRKQAEIENVRKTEEQRQEERRYALMENGEDKYDDFQEVVKASKLQIAEPAYLAILESDLSSDLVYFLAKNDEEANRISQLSPYAQAKEIGKLEDKLAQRPTKKTSNAPEPIKPINTGKNGDAGLSDELPIDEWMRRRNKQVRG